MENCQFYKNVAKKAAVSTLYICSEVVIKDCIFASNLAENIAVFTINCLDPELYVNISNSNFTNNRATSWCGCIVLDQSSGLEKDLIFHHSSAPTIGCYVDFCLVPSQRTLSSSKFLNNSAKKYAGAFTTHINNFVGKVESTYFVDNTNSDGIGSNVALLGDDTTLTIENCFFDTSKDKTIFIKWNEYTTVKSIDNKYNITYSFNNIANELDIAEKSIFP